jgi:signal recognition particle subunit SRP54
MLEGLTDKFTKLRRKLLGYGALSGKEISDALREIRMTLLEADVNVKVAGEFIKGLEAALEKEQVAKSIRPGELITATLYRELVNLLGAKPEKLSFSNDPTIICLVGLQGTGKTSTAAKLGVRFKGRNPLLVACDIKRPAASEQLRQLAVRAGVAFFPVMENALKTCKEALKQAKTKGNHLVILDTAGRLHINDELMAELASIRDDIKPHYNLLVVDGMTGQDAVAQATEFNTRLGLSGIIVTKLDGDARGGAVVSVRKVSGAPVYFAGTGEKLEDLEEFYPERIASRILGMGDVASLAEKVQAATSAQDQRKLAEKFIKGKFDLEDFLTQMKSLRKMGNLGKLMSMIPGMQGMDFDEREFTRLEAMIQSMTPAERNDPDIVDGSRRRRIASGSGTSVESVNRLLKEFHQARDLAKMMGKGGMGAMGNVLNAQVQRGRRR